MPKSIWTTVAVAAFAVVATSALDAQGCTDDGCSGAVRQLAGPRFGATVVTGSLAGRLRRYGIQPVMTQIGWQSEQSLRVTPDSARYVNEQVWLIGATEQHSFLPSLSWVLGYRTADGREIGAGVNLSLAPGAVLAVGKTFSFGPMVVPVNLATVVGGDGVRLSLLTGIAGPDLRRR